MTLHASHWWLFGLQSILACFSGSVAVETHIEFPVCMHPSARCHLLGHEGVAVLNIEIVGPPKFSCAFSRHFGLKMHIIPWYLMQADITSICAPSAVSFWKVLHFFDTRVVHYCCARSLAVVHASKKTVKSQNWRYTIAPTHVYF